MCWYFVIDKEDFFYWEGLFRGWKVAVGMELVM